MNLTDLFSGTMPWYVAGPLIGLIVPTLLILGNKSLGISSSMRHICASCTPVAGNVSFFKYDWRKEIWNLFFVGGIFLGGLIINLATPNNSTIDIHPDLQNELNSYGITNISGLIPNDLFNWTNLFTIKGILLMALGGFLVGFGTRYAGGCTSGHTIMGLSNLQLPSLIATISFMIGGFIGALLLLPLILSL